MAGVRFTDTAGRVTFNTAYQSVTTNGPTDEEIRDLVAGFVTADLGIDITHNDAGDTLSIGAEVQTFTPFLVLPLSVALVGGSITGDELTVAALAGGGPYPVPVGRSVLVAGDGADNGSYRALSEGGVAGYSDGVLTFDPVAQQPFTEAHVNKDVFSFNPFSTLPYGGQIVDDGSGGYELAQIAVPPTSGQTEGDLLSVVDVGGGTMAYEWASPIVPTTDGTTTGQVLTIGSTGTPLNAEWTTVDDAEPPAFWPQPDYEITTKVLRADMEASGPTYDARSGAWETADPGVDITTAGLDIRAMLYLEHPVNAGIGETGTSDTFQEVLTQEHPTATGGDRFEAAIFWSDSSFSGYDPGRPHTFFEHLEAAGTTEVSNYAEAWIDPYRWVCLRWTIDIANDTVTMWRAVPYRITTSSVKTADDGITWWPVFTDTGAEYGTFNANDTLSWFIGKQATMSVAWLNARTYGNATANLVNVTAAGVDALSVGATSYTDTLGNVWTTTDGQVTAAPVIDATGGGGAPDAHAASHANGGSDEVSIDASQVTTGTLDIARIPDRPPLQIQVTGRYIRTGDRGGAAAPTTNRVFYLPIWIETACTVDRIGVFHEATTGGASSVARLAIYTNSGMLPSSKVVEATVDLTTAAAFKAATISQSLTRGLHWLAVASQPTSGSPTYSWGPPYILCGDTTGTASGALFDTSTYSSTLPSTATPGSVATQPPIVYVRVA